MFTNKQVQRMEYVVDNCRAGLKTSLGGTLPAGTLTRDALPLGSVNPGGSETIGCTATTYPSSLFCPGSVIPKVRIYNNGQSTLSTVSVGLIFDGGTPVVVNLSPNLAFGASAVATFPAVTAGAGTHSFKYYTFNANGAGPDQNVA